MGILTENDPQMSLESVCSFTIHTDNVSMGLQRMSKKIQQWLAENVDQTYEMIVDFVKGGSMLHSFLVKHIQQYTIVMLEKKYHPSENPEELIIEYNLGTTCLKMNIKVNPTILKHIKDNTI